MPNLEIPNSPRFLKVAELAELLKLSLDLRSRRPIVQIRVNHDVADALLAHRVERIP